MAKNHIVYVTTSQDSGKWYIGVHSTDNIDDGYLGSGKILKNSISKYGKDRHKRRILFDCKSREEALSLEKTMLTESALNSEKCMNLCEGGLGGNLGATPWNKDKKLSKDHINKLSEAKQGYIPWNKGLKAPYSQEQIDSMVQSRLNKSGYGQKQPQTHEWITPEGNFKTSQEAADYYGLTKQAIHHRVKSETFKGFKKIKISKK